VPDVDAAGPSDRVGIADDVDRATVAEQMVELRMLGELVDPLEVDEQQTARVLSGRLRR
jgi:hypothetical protein